MTSVKSVKAVGIIGLGAYLPERRLTNEDIEKMVDTSDEWILTRTGIRERRIAAEGEVTSDMAAKAAEAALRDAGLSADKIEMIIVATITPDMLFPSTACAVQARIRAANAFAFDISAACTGFVYALSVAEKFIKAGAYKNALVIGAEKLSAITDWTDRNTCVLLGDGAGACVLAPVKSGGILSTFLASDGTLIPLLNMPGGGTLNPATHETVDKRLHYLKMNGPELFKHAVKSMADAATKAVCACGLKEKDIDIVIPHQANIRILLAVAKKIGLAENKLFLNISKYGNMSSASTAVALYDAVKQGRIKKGDIVVIDAFGAGLTWGAMVIKW